MRPDRREDGRVCFPVHLCDVPVGRVRPAVGAEWERDPPPDVVSCGWRLDRGLTQIAVACSNDIIAAASVG
jgi:hypothetical protein